MKFRKKVEIQFRSIIKNKVRFWMTALLPFLSLVHDYDLEFQELPWVPFMDKRILCLWLYQRYPHRSQEEEWEMMLEKYRNLPGMQAEISEKKRTRNLPEISTKHVDGFGSARFTLGLTRYLLRWADFSEIHNLRGCFQGFAWNQVWTSLGFSTQEKLLFLFSGSNRLW